jgi:hypothetical protein
MNLTTKAFILLMMLISQNLQASIIRIHFLNIKNMNHAIELKEVLTSKYNIPEFLIIILKKRVCKEDSFNLCLNKKGELKKLSLHRIENFKKSFSIFNLESKNEF